MDGLKSFAASVGPGELVVLAIITLIIFGGGKLPEIGDALGRAVRSIFNSTR